MNAGKRILVSAAVLLIFGFGLCWGTFGVAQAQETTKSSSATTISTEDIEIPGGIVYSDGKEAIYQDFKTKQKTSLTADLKKTIVGPVAISENGKILIWLQEGSFWIKELPDGKPVVITIDASDEKEAKRLKTLLQPMNIKKITTSPEGDQIAYESKSGEIGWFQIKQEDEESLSKEEIRVKISSKSGAAFPVLCQRNVSSAEKSKKNIPIIAFIDKTTGKWGPIEIHRAEADAPGLLTSWEIPVSLTNCQGLAWKPISITTPDGLVLKSNNRVLTYFSDGNIFEISGILGNLIDNNRPNKEPTDEQVAGLFPSLTPSERKRTIAIQFEPAGITFIRQGSLAARGVNGINFHWISNETLIFRGFDGALYSRTQKPARYKDTVDPQGRHTAKIIAPAPPPEKKKLLDSVPLDFSYCNRSIFATVENKTPEIKEETKNP